VMSHPFTGDTPAAAAVHLNVRSLLAEEKMPVGLARDLGIKTASNQ